MGELTEAVRNRSVYRQLHLEPAGKRTGFSGKLSDLRVSAAGPLPGYADMPWRQVTAAANSLAADGAEGLAVFIQGCLPVTYEEGRLREDMKQFAAEIKANGMEPGDAHIQVSGQTDAAQYFVTAVGRDFRAAAAQESAGTGTDHCQEPLGSETDSGMGQCGQRKSLQPGQELVLTCQIALAGTAALARAHREELRRRFPFWLVDRAEEFDQFMPVAGDARIAYRSGADTVYSVGEGGIFNALWEMAECAGVGLEADLRAIPVNQETIEICEYFDLNPYYLYSAGCLLIGTGRSQDLVTAFSDAGVPAAVIGRVTDGNDRIICNGENRRYLDRPKQDELWRKGGDQL
ncbi:MAG: hypothetical protein LUD18_00395 [Lachnospiraceae bacterium]|nr:hypothetical protein [Lachnospiraceae bacterium]